MLALPFRLVRNLFRLLRFALEWLVLWPVVLLRRRQRNFVRLDLKDGFRLVARKGLAARWAWHPSYEEVARTLDQIERSGDVEGVLMRVSASGVRLGDAALLRDRLIRLRRSGKRVVCYFETAGVAAMVVASAADTVIMPPAGQIVLTGLKAELTFVRDLLARWGLRGQFIHIGRYKTAGNTFTRSRSSLAQRRMVEGLLRDVSASVAALVRRSSPALDTAPAPERTPGKGDATSDDEAASSLGRPTYTASQARRAGLADHQAFPDQIRTRLRAERAGDDFDPFGTFGDEETAEEHSRRLRCLPQVSIWKSASFRRLPPRLLRLSPLWRRQPEIAVVEMSGIILPDEAVSGPLGSRPHIAPAAVRRVFKRLRRSGHVKAVVLAIDSRGGSALASDLIWREVRRLRHEKPVIAALRSVAASGGYYIAVGANEIVADRTTLTGSIGIVAGKISAELALDKASIAAETLTTGPYATLLSPRHAWTAKHIAALRAELRASYRRFVNRVATGRGIRAKRVHLLARGRVYTGQQALRQNLVDVVGTLEDAIDRAADRARLPRRHLRVTYQSLAVAGLRGLLAGGAQAPTGLLEVLEPDVREALALCHLLRADRILAYYDGSLSVTGY